MFYGDKNGRLVFVSGFFSIIAVVSCFLSVKFTTIFGFPVPASIVFYSFLFPVMLIILEVWNLRTLLTIVGFTCFFAAFTLIFAMVTALFEATELGVTNTQYSAVFMLTPRIFAGRVVGLSVSSLLAGLVSRELKKREKFPFWLRAIIVATIGIVIETTFTFIIAYAGASKISAATFFMLYAGGIVIKELIGVVVGVPLTMLTIYLFDKYDEHHHV